MRVCLSFPFTVLALSLFTLVFADSHAVGRSSNHASARRRHAVNALDARRDTQPHKRYSDARFSFYDAGQNACGSVDTDSDYIVAINTEQWNGGQYCYQTVTLSYGGKTTQATITDECMGCPEAGLDLSRGLFDFFASESMGIIYGTWEFDTGAPSSSSSWVAPSSTWTPTSTYIPPPAPTTSWTPLSSYTPTSTWSPPTTYSLFSSYSSFSSSATPSSTSSSQSSSATPTPTPSSTTAAQATPSASFDQGNLNQFNMALVGLSGLLEAANWT